MSMVARSSTVRVATRFLVVGLTRTIGMGPIMIIDISLHQYYLKLGRFKLVEFWCMFVCMNFRDNLRYV